MKILIVEDDRSYRKGLLYELEYLGYDVTEAHDGKEAIDLIKTNSYDLVISDLMLPLSDGIEVYHALQKINPTTKFVLLTAYSNSEKAKKANMLLKENFLLKSVDHDFLFQRINQLLQEDKSNEKYYKKNK